MAGSPPSGAPTRPPARLVLLGASNLFLALPAALAHALDRLRRHDLSVLAAHGPGRSYGVEAGVLGFRFTGIARSGILEHLQDLARREGPAPSWALLTDVGNDILYRAGVERILAWVEEIARRLLALGARLAITSLPVDSVEALPRWKFRLLRPLYFPLRPMPLEEVLAQARALQEGLAGMGRSPGIQLLPAPSRWYGFDHFHLRWGLRREAMGSWLDALLGAARGAAAPEEADPRTGPPPRLALSGARLRFHPPAEYLLFGRRRRSPAQGVEITPGARLFSF